MSVYVDDAIWPFGNMVMCHMMGDTLEELHSMAEAIGIRRQWFQNHHGKVPHYDVCQSKRELALAAGAVAIDRPQCGEIMRRLRAAAAPARDGVDPTRGGKVRHPLRWLFMLRAVTPREGMNWLQERGHVSDLCLEPEEVAAVDVARVLQLARRVC